MALPDRVIRSNACLTRPTVLVGAAPLLAGAPINPQLQLFIREEHILTHRERGRLAPLFRSPSP